MNFNDRDAANCVLDDTIGGRISLARDALDVSAQSMAEVLGVETSTWCDWENDRAAPRANRLAMIAGVLGVGLSWLLTGRGAGPR